MFYYSLTFNDQRKTGITKVIFLKNETLTMIADLDKSVAWIDFSIIFLKKLLPL